MMEIRCSKDSWLDEKLSAAIIGDETINAATREDPMVAHIIGYHIKNTYELGAENVSKAAEQDDPWEFGKLALEHLDTANRQAAQKAHELGII